MGIFQHDLEEITSNKAEELAKQKYGREFSDLPASLQMQVWMEAEQEAHDYFASQADAIYDRMKENDFLARGNGHKPKEDREAHWNRLELDRRLGK